MTVITRKRRNSTSTKMKEGTANNASVIAQQKKQNMSDTNVVVAGIIAKIKKIKRSVIVLKKKNINAIDHAIKRENVKDRNAIIDL